MRIFACHPYDMMTSSNGNIFRVTGHLCGEFNSPHKGQWLGALVFSLISVWINDWVNNREADDLRGYRAHYDVIVMLVVSRMVPQTISAQHCSSARMHPTSGHNRKPAHFMYPLKGHYLCRILQSTCLRFEYTHYSQFISYHCSIVYTG